MLEGSFLKETFGLYTNNFGKFEILSFYNLGISLIYKFWINTSIDLL